MIKKFSLKQKSVLLDKELNNFNYSKEFNNLSQAC